MLTLPNRFDLSDDGIKIFESKYFRNFDQGLSLIQLESASWTHAFRCRPRSLLVIENSQTYIIHCYSKTWQQEDSLQHPFHLGLNICFLPSHEHRSNLKYELSTLSQKQVYRNTVWIEHVSVID